MVVRLSLAIAALLCALPAHAGSASWYGPGFHGRKTASGERYNQNAATCAHKSLDFGTTLIVTNLKNGRTAACRVNDRGPYVSGRSLDVSRAVAVRLGMVRAGVVPVRIEVAGGA